MSGTESVDLRYGSLLMIGAMLAFACLDGVRKHLSEALAPAQIMMFRYLCFGAIVAWLVRLRGFALFRTRHPWTQLVRSTVMVLEEAVFILALRHASLAEAHAVFSLAPILGAVFAILLLRERVGPAVWISLLVSLGGILIILRPDFSDAQTGLLLALLAAALFALYGVLTRKVGAGDSTETSFAIMTVAGLAITLAFGIASWTDPSRTDWGFLGLLAASAAVGQFLMIRAYSLAPAATLQPYHYSMFAWAVLISIVFFGEAPTAPSLLGAALVVGSGLYAFTAASGRPIRDAQPAR